MMQAHASTVHLAQAPLPPAHAVASTAVRTPSTSTPDAAGFDTELLRGRGTDVPADAIGRVLAPPGLARVGDRSRVAFLRQMQRTHGNRAVLQMLAQRSMSAAHVQPMRATPVATATATTYAPGASVVADAPSVDAGATDAVVQREAADDAPWWKVATFGESVAWKMMGQFAPELAPIVRGGTDGVTDWLRARVSGAADMAFNTLMSPVRAVSGVGAQLSEQFTPWVATLQDAAAKIAANDCSPISQAADRIEATAEKIITPIVEKLQPVVAKIQGFLNAAWEKVGAPVWDWVKEYAGRQWDQVKQLASWIWQFSEPMRSLGQDAWNWLKNKIGIGDGPEGENGILQWLQGKFEAVWNSVKSALAPFTKQLEVMRSALGSVAQILIGPVGRIGTLVAQAGKGISWLGTHLGKGNAIVEARAYVEKSLVPPLIDGLRQLGAAVTGVAGSIGASLGKVAGSLDAAAATLANPLLHFIASAVQWLAGEINALTGWANQKLGGVATWLQAAITQLEGFLRGLAQFLQKVEGVVANIWSLPTFLAEKIWHWTPACIRDPVVDFVVPIILRQVELFEELVRDNEAWQKTKAQVMGIVRKVFVDRDLLGAVRAAFDLVLRVFNIPPEMLSKVASKAAAAWDVVAKKPLDFIKNTVHSLGHGFQLLWSNLATHLGHGIEGWLFGELADKDIHPPASWSEPKDLFGFVTDVLGLSMSHILELLKKRVDPRVVKKVESWVGRFRRAWDWITDAIDTSKSPAQNSQGLMTRAKDFGKSILSGAVEWVTGKVATELATLAAGAAASGGLSEVIDVARRIYKAMVTAKRFAGRILQMAGDTLDQVLDIASGNVSKVGAEFEKLMDKGMPVVIGFLADQVGLGGIGAAIRNIVDKLRGQVDAAILWLIDKVKAGIEAVVGGIRAGANALADWLGLRKRFTAFNHPHELYFVGTGSSARLVVASVETDVQGLLQAGGKLEKDVLASKDAAREDALKRARTEYAKAVTALGELKVSANDFEANARLSAAVKALSECLAQTGVDAPLPIVGGRQLIEGLTVGAFTGKGPVPVTIQSIDVQKENFHYTDEQASMRGYLGFGGYGRAWMFVDKPGDLKMQCHHLIPYEHSKHAHSTHQLVVLAAVDLERDWRNKIWVVGHDRRHSSDYHAEVGHRLTKAWSALPAKTQAAANHAIEEVMNRIAVDISNQSLPLYADKPVSTHTPVKHC